MKLRIELRNSKDEVIYKLEHSMYITEGSNLSLIRNSIRYATEQMFSKVTSDIQRKFTGQDDEDVIAERSQRILDSIEEVSEEEREIEDENI